MEEEEKNDTRSIPDRIFSVVLSEIKEYSEFDEEVITKIQELYNADQMKKKEKVIAVIKPE